MSTTHLPDLSTEDQIRLARFFASNEDPASLILPPVNWRQDGGKQSDKERPILTSEAEPANRPAAPPTSLLAAYAFLTRPDIAAWIAFHREQVARRLRNAILSALESSLARATDPIEIRRASATILRALTVSAPPPRGAPNIVAQRAPRSAPERSPTVMQREPEPQRVGANLASSSSSPSPSTPRPVVPTQPAPSAASTDASLPLSAAATTTHSRQTTNRAAKLLTCCGQLVSINQPPTLTLPLPHPPPPPSAPRRSPTPPAPRSTPR